MCELFGMCANDFDRATISLPIFSKESEYNPDGWGISYYKDREAILKREPTKAKDSELFFKTVEEAKSNIIISHIRYATQGDICELNCHPFKEKYLNREWIFAHNGNVKITKHDRTVGGTDSESVFHFLLDEMQKYQNEGILKGIYPSLKGAITSLFKNHGTSMTLNFLMSDGELLFVFNHYTAKPIYLLKREKPYGDAILVSTVKLSGEDWKKIPENRILVLNRGEVVVLSDPII